VRITTLTSQTQTSNCTSGNSPGNAQKLSPNQTRSIAVLFDEELDFQSSS